MFVAYVVVATLLAVVLAASGLAKLVKRPQIVESLGGLGVPRSWLPAVALAEIAGAAGLLIGLWFPALGIAASAGVAAYFIGAVIAHLRAHHGSLAPPAILGLFAAAAIVLRALSAS